MIVVDTSALVAMVFAEERAEDLRARLFEAEKRVVAATAVVELGTVLAARQKLEAAQTLTDVQAFFTRSQVDVIAIDTALSLLALEARIRFGKGFGARAGLNFGDSFAYALAKSLNAPLLYVGDDFTHTDITPALAVQP